MSKKKSLVGWGDIKDFKTKWFGIYPNKNYYKKHLIPIYKMEMTGLKKVRITIEEIK